MTTIIPGSNGFPVSKARKALVTALHSIQKIPLARRKKGGEFSSFQLALSTKRTYAIWSVRDSILAYDEESYVLEGAHRAGQLLLSAWKKDHDGDLTSAFEEFEAFMVRIGELLNKNEPSGSGQ